MTSRAPIPRRPQAPDPRGPRRATPDLQGPDLPDLGAQGATRRAPMRRRAPDSVGSAPKKLFEDLRPFRRFQLRVTDNCSALCWRVSWLLVCVMMAG